MSLQSEMLAGSGHRGTFQVRIYGTDLNFKEVVSHDPIITGRKVAELQGARSADGYVILQFLPNGATEDLRLEEEIKLHGDKQNLFFVAEADGTSNLFVDEMRVAWFDLPITGAAIRFLANKGEEFAVFQEFRGQPDKLVGDREAVSLEGKGTERFHTERMARKVTVYLADQAHKINAGDYTTEQLKEVLGVDTSYNLDLVGDDGAFNELKPGQHTTVKDGMKFVAYLPTGQSS